MWKAILLGILLSALLIADALPDMNSPDSVPTFAVPDPGFRPGYLSDTIPDRMEVGKTYPVIIRFQNTGLVSWVSKFRRTGLVYEGDLLQVVALPSFVEIPEGAAILPGQEFGFAFNLLPVGKPGVYPLTFYVSMRSAQDDIRVSEIFTKTITIVPSYGISSPNKGSISVESPGRVLSISLNGLHQGVTPSIIPDLTPGTYQIHANSSGYQKDLSVVVARGSIAHVFLDNTSDKAEVKQEKVGPVSDGSLAFLLAENVSLLGIVFALVIFCAGVMAYAIQRRRKGEEEHKKAESKIRPPPQTQEEIRLEAERDLMKKMHEKPPAFGMASTIGNVGSSPASGGGLGSLLPDLPYHELTEVHTREEVLEAMKEEEWNALMGKPGPGIAPGNGPADTGGEVEITVQEMHPKPGSLTVSLLVKNRSREVLKLLDTDLHPSDQIVVEADIDEPDDDTYETSLSLSFFTEKGLELLKKIQIPYNQGIALLARGMTEKAYEFFSRIFKQDPQNTDALLRKVDILMKWGLEQEALLLLEQAQAAKPDDTVLQDALIRMQKYREKEQEEKQNKKEPPKVPGFPDPIIERYTPIRILGEDAYAIIYLVMDKKSGELRAVKIPRIFDIPKQSLFTEVSILYQLRHPNVLRMFRAEFSPVTYLELEYVSGVEIEGVHVTTLEDLPVPVREPIWYPIIEGIAQGIGYLHSRGFMHYHLHPSIILLDDPLTPKISGIVRGSMNFSELSQGRKSQYHAPEQEDRAKYGKPGKKTDIFQLGLLWYYLMTGYIAYSSEALKATGEYIFTDDIKAFQILILPSELDEKNRMYDPLFRKMLAVKKADRYQSVDEFLEDLRSVHLRDDPENAE